VVLLSTLTPPPYGSNYMVAVGKMSRPHIETCGAPERASFLI
jgi:hypothetical protein